MFLAKGRENKKKKKMPPKKDGKKKQKGLKNLVLEPGEDLRMDPLELRDMQISRANLKKECLEEEYVVRRNLRTEAHQEEQELRERKEQLEADYKAQKDERYDIISDFTRQNKSMQDELIIRINDLESTICDLKDQLELSKIALHEIKNDKDQQIKQKEKEIDEQAEKMEDMSQEFHAMLQETLEKMNERIDEKHKDSQEVPQSEEQDAEQTSPKDEDGSNPPEPEGDDAPPSPQ
eukprot:TRINITY_DN10099_c1_g1_i4.p1 TRINITY_DN10099_c1_g1~~TRINITY_DN10099_c1_g1_i4.p1  ORF type:complete len:235 (+),score=83.22 TRINITY_DN10099_c1_g1_i4:733-1437(+)